MKGLGKFRSAKQTLPRLKGCFWVSFVLKRPIQSKSFIRFGVQNPKP